MDCWMKYSTCTSALAATTRLLPLFAPCPIREPCSRVNYRLFAPRSTPITFAALEHEGEAAQRLATHRRLRGAGRHDDGDLDLGRDVDRRHLHAAADSAELEDDLTRGHVHGPCPRSGESRLQLRYHRTKPRRDMPMA